MLKTPANGPGVSLTTGPCYLLFPLERPCSLLILDNCCSVLGSQYQGSPPPRNLSAPSPGIGPLSRLTGSPRDSMDGRTPPSGLSCQFLLCLSPLPSRSRQQLCDFPWPTSGPAPIQLDAPDGLDGALAKAAAFFLLPWPPSQPDGSHPLCA